MFCHALYLGKQPNRASANDGMMSNKARFLLEPCAIGFNKEMVRSKPITNTAKEFHAMENCLSSIHSLHGMFPKYHCTVKCHVESFLMV